MGQKKNYKLIFSTILIFVFISSCISTTNDLNRLKSLKIDYDGWRTDTIACLGIRCDNIEYVINNERKFLEINDDNVLDFFGKPNKIHTQSLGLNDLTKGVYKRKSFIYRYTGCKNDSVYAEVFFNFRNNVLYSINRVVVG